MGVMSLEGMNCSELLILPLDYQVMLALFIS
jgi:hypothetical protein